jgi:hypothetical protein
MIFVGGTHRATSLVVELIKVSGSIKTKATNSIRKLCCEELSAAGWCR